MKAIVRRRSYKSSSLYPGFDIFNESNDSESTTIMSAGVPIVVDTHAVTNPRPVDQPGSPIKDDIEDKNYLIQTSTSLSRLSTPSGMSLQTPTSLSIDGIQEPNGHHRRRPDCGGSWVSNKSFIIA